MKELRFIIFINMVNFKMYFVIKLKFIFGKFFLKEIQYIYNINMNKLLYRG